ncbi:hypothetical protein [Methylobacterium iners]|uniref:Uncharacterized protein n=1 Tax=Methylobacterium iners TaxID=418707 RepID=A0ABQ4RUU4_9HYPH|nr:hypothetical protein [Methylobacterium iners]GJD94150.1 hypothetical protein OCOJLMKI_1352 [Methylobacterium iners]
MIADRDPRVKLLTLREYRSSEGRTYFRGWLGDAVVLVFRDDDATPEYGSVATWDAYVVPKKPKPSGDRPAPAAGARRRPSPNRPIPMRRERETADTGAMPNDETPF